MSDNIIESDVHDFPPHTFEVFEIGINKMEISNYIITDGEYIVDYFFGLEVKNRPSVDNVREILSFKVDDRIKKIGSSRKSKTSSLYVWKMVNS